MEWIRKGGAAPCLNINKQGEVVYLTFPALCETGLVEHLFSTRMGGVSKGIFSTMNLSFSRGDNEEDVQENFRRIAQILHGKKEDIVCSDQTHTTNIRIVSKKDCGKGVVFPKDYTDIDGLITDEKDIILATFFADCVPLYFLDTKKRVIGLAHSGWRGSVGRMGQCMISRMEEAFGCRKENILACIGPSICQACYEVSEDVADEFRKEFGESVLAKGKCEGKYQLDLWKANQIVLEDAGLTPEQISTTDICTCCNGELLFSHRKSEGKRGNLGAFMKLTDI